jgi:hypothetical protein
MREPCDSFIIVGEQQGGLGAPSGDEKRTWYEFVQRDIDTRHVVINSDGSMSVALPVGEAKAAGLYERAYACRVEPEAGTVNGERYDFAVTDREPMQAPYRKAFLAGYLGYYWSTFIVGLGTCEGDGDDDEADGRICETIAVRVRCLVSVDVLIATEVKR